MPVKLLVVGGGKMGGALVGGLVGSGWSAPSGVGVVEPVPERRQELAALHPGLVTLAAPEPGIVEPGGGAVLAVKPEAAEVACRALAAAGVGRVLSVVAGMAAQRLEAVLAPGAAVVRAMPNAPALIGAGVTAMAGGSNVTAADLDWAEGVLGAVGRVVRLPERHLDAVTGLSGSGPAYVSVVAEALVEAGVLVGLPRDVSRTLTVETLLGSATLLARGEAPEELRAAVTSPGGTTAAGLRVLEARAVRSAFVEAVVAATERARSLGR
ncbi:MAG TPA: pyrroline-5-carboxylate reductase [Acidimicrobiales bacterium]|nr:pyrroline-5-carboxylate reductase [Acidimicrobiales bacterium]